MDQTPQERPKGRARRKPAAKVPKREHVPGSRAEGRGTSQAIRRWFPPATTPGDPSMTDWQGYRTRREAREHCLPGEQPVLEVVGR